MRAKQGKKLINPEAPPKFRDWRRTNDAVMVPDPAFVRQLRILDPKAFVQWDWGSQRWEIWRKPEGKEPIMLLRVEAKDKSYRELGADVLLKLQEGDPRRFSLKQLVQYFNAMDDRVAEAKEREFRNRFEAVHRERRWFFKGLRVSVPKAWERMAIPIEGPKEPRIPVLKKSPMRTIGRMVSNGEYGEGSTDG